MLEISRLSVSIARKILLDDINYKTEATGKIIGIMGPNGAGKSTLIKSMLGFIPHSGQVTFDDKPLTQMKTHIAYVPQKSVIDLDFPISVEQTIAMGDFKKNDWFQNKKHTQQKVQEMINLMELTELKNRTLNTLSGGQLQRVLVARSLLTEKKIYFLDEPFVGIDFNSSSIILRMINDLKAQGKLIFIIHHDIESARTIFDEIILLNQSIVAVGHANEILTDRYLKKAFFGSKEVQR